MCDAEFVEVVNMCKAEDYICEEDDCCVRGLGENEKRDST